MARGGSQNILYGDLSCSMKHANNRFENQLEQEERLKEAYQKLLALADNNPDQANDFLKQLNCAYPVNYSELLIKINNLQQVDHLTEEKINQQLYKLLTATNLSNSVDSSSIQKDIRRIKFYLDDQDVFEKYQESYYQQSLSALRNHLLKLLSRHNGILRSNIKKVDTEISLERLRLLALEIEAGGENVELLNLKKSAKDLKQIDQIRCSWFSSRSRFKQLDKMLQAKQANFSDEYLIIEKLQTQSGKLNSGRNSELRELIQAANNLRSYTIMVCRPQHPVNLINQDPKDAQDLFKLLVDNLYK